MKKGEIAIKKKLIIKITVQIEEIVGNTAKPPNPTGQVEITLKPTGEIEVSLKPTGEPGGEQAVSIILGGATYAPTGEIEVPMNSTGQQAVEIKPTGQQAVGITNGGSNGQNPVAMDGGATKQM